MRAIALAIIISGVSITRTMKGQREADLTESEKVLDVVLVLSSLLCLVMGW
jgi:hypothetical protein